MPSIRNLKEIVDEAIEDMDKIEWSKDPTIGEVVKFISTIEMLEFLKSEFK
jgi:hypothetical protein